LTPATRAVVRAEAQHMATAVEALSEEPFNEEYVICSQTEGDLEKRSRQPSIYTEILDLEHR
jgi:hypothetical protein